MEVNIVAFGASSSKASINKKFAAYAASRFENASVEVLDFNDFIAPLFSVDEEKEKGIPQMVHRFFAKLQPADLIIISLAEHNGSYTAAFKNTFDWASRLKVKLFEGKKLLLLSTSTGQGGGKLVLESAVRRFPKHGAEIAGQFSLPVFVENFSEERGILDARLQRDFENILENVKKLLCQNSD